MLERDIVKPILEIKTKHYPSPNVLIITPPRLDGAAAFRENGNYDEASEAKSVEIDELYKEVASRNHVAHFSALDQEVGCDGVHLTKNAHEDFANQLCSEITSIFDLE